MFVGHLAVALAAKRVEPGVSLGWLVGASFGLDLIWPVLLLAGLERVRIDPGNTAFTPLAFDAYPWSHSLLMVGAWALAAGGAAAAVYGRRRAGTIVGSLVLSHWVLDWVTHRPDLPLWPDGPMTGLGLWQSVAATLVVEGGLFVAGIAAYVRFTHARDRTGFWALAGLIGLTGLIWISSPWSPAPPHARAIAFAGLASWLFPVWGAWIERHRGLNPPRVAGP